MEPKGFILIKKEFIATRLWPNPQLTFNGIIDLESVYKTALAGKLVPILDIAVDGSGYLVLGQTEESGTFIWTIEKDDTVDGSFLPVKWKYGILIPTGLSAMDEFMYLAKSNQKEKDKYTKF